MPKTKKSEVQNLLEGKINLLTLALEMSRKEREITASYNNEKVNERNQKSTCQDLETQKAMMMAEIARGEASSLTQAITSKVTKNNQAISPDATDLASAITLVNEIKTIINDMNS